MEIRTYDQVDAAQVLALNMVALDFPFTPALADSLRRHDRRCLPFLSGGELLRVRCPVLPQDVSLAQVVARLRELYFASYVMVDGLVLSEHKMDLQHAGYDVQESWGTVMLKPLGPHRDVRHLLGLDEGRFYIDSLDIT